MLSEQLLTIQAAIAYQEVDNAAFTSAVIDTADLISGEFHVKFASLAAALATFKLMESDVRTDAHTLSGATLVQDFDKPDSDQDGTIWVLNLHRYLDGAHKRYIQLQATAGNGGGTKSKLDTNFIGVPKVGSSTADARGVDNVITVDTAAAA